MSLAEEQVLVDSANLAIIFMGVGLLAGMLARRRPEMLPSTPVGRVSVSMFGRAELSIAVAMIFFLYLVVRHPDALRPLSNSLFLALGLSSYFISRNCDLLELFGLTECDWPKLGRQAGIAALAIIVITLGVHQGWLDWLTKLMDDKPDIQDKVKELQDIKDWGGRLSFMFTACVLAPVAEEMVFRGFLYPALKRFAHPWIAATVVAAMFAVIHLSLGALLPLFVLSLLLTLSYEWTGSLAVPVFVHAAFNLTNVILTLWGPHAP